MRLSTPDYSWQELAKQYSRLVNISAWWLKA